MFIILLKYVKPLEEVEKNLYEHRKYLDKYYGLKKFICSGRRNPRTGGVIICNAESREEVEAIIKEDAFYINDVAEYEMIEFEATKFIAGFEDLLK